MAPPATSGPGVCPVFFENVQSKTSSFRSRASAVMPSASCAAAAGVTPRWMRPPYGYRNPWLNGVVTRRGNAGVAMWSIAARDWKTEAAEPVIERLRRARGGDIVLLHDGDHRVPEGKRLHVVAALEYWLPRWKDAGVRFVTMNEIEQELR